MTCGFKLGQLVLPLPSLEVLAGAAVSGANRRGVVVHILESCVVAWMKQVKVKERERKRCMDGTEHLHIEIAKNICVCITRILLLLQMAMYFDPQADILKSHGKQAGPMAEVQVSSHTQQLTADTSLVHCPVLVQPVGQSGLCEGAAGLPGGAQHPAQFRASSQYLLSGIHPCAQGCQQGERMDDETL